MSKIRIPVSHTQEFKTFCKIFAKDLESEVNIRLRGRELLNAMSIAAGHEHYADLLRDSATYGEGEFKRNILATTMAPVLSKVLSIDSKVLFGLLTFAALKITQGAISSGGTILDEFYQWSEEDLNTRNTKTADIG